MKTAADTLAIARRDIGTKEGANNWNPFAEIAGHQNNQPWCATFVVSCLVRAGVVPTKSPSAYCPALKAAHTPVELDDVQPGDVMFVYFAKMGRDAHSGLVEAVFDDHVITIEGNTDVKGGRTGGQVMRKKRSFKGLSFARPAYAAAPPPPPAPRRPDPELRLGSKGQSVLNVQRALNKFGFPVGMDGEFGPNTEKALKAFQRRRRLAADGVAGPNTWKALRSPS